MFGGQQQDCWEVFFVDFHKKMELFLLIKIFGNTIYITRKWNKLSRSIFINITYFVYFRSLSFVLVTSCFAYILLTGLYIVIDILKWWTGKPFIFAGMNATIMYVGHSLTHNMFPFQWGLLQTNLHFQLFAQAVWGTSLWVLIAYWLFQNKFFLSI